MSHAPPFLVGQARREVHAALMSCHDVTRGSREACPEPGRLRLSAALMGNGE